MVLVCLKIYPAYLKEAPEFCRQIEILTRKCVFSVAYGPAGLFSPSGEDRLGIDEFELARHTSLLHHAPRAKVGQQRSSHHGRPLPLREGVEDHSCSQFRGQALPPETLGKSVSEFVQLSVLPIGFRVYPAGKCGGLPNVHGRKTRGPCLRISGGPAVQFSCPCAWEARSAISSAAETPVGRGCVERWAD